MAVFGKAQYIKRVEDDRLLTGTGGFTDNLARPNQVHVVLVRSPHAHARIVKIDTAAARKAPGVVAVFTWDDMAKEGCGYFAFPAMFPNADGSKPEMTPRRPLAHEVVRYVGEAVVAVVAETPRPGAGRGRAGRGRVRSPAVGDRDRGCAEARRAAGLEGRARQPGRLQPLRRCRQGRRRLQGGRARRVDRHRAPAADRERDGAARDHGRMGRRSPDRPYRQPEPVGHARHAVPTSSSRCPRTRCACWCATSAAASA